MSGNDSVMTAMQFGEAAEKICKAQGGRCYNSKTPEEKCPLYTKGQGCLKPKGFRTAIIIAEKWMREHPDEDPDDREADR